MKHINNIKLIHTLKYDIISIQSFIIPSITEGLAISNKTMPVSRSRILKRIKSILYIFASGAHKYPVTKGVYK